MHAQVVGSLAEPVGSLWLQLQEKYTAEGRFHVASPLSSTPLPVYRWIVRHAASSQCWEDVTFVLMDEQLEGAAAPFRYVPLDDPASYEGFARRHLLDPVESVTAVPIEILKPPIDAISEFATGIHLLVLALGVGGNYANVMPNTSQSTGWHIAQLTPEFRHTHTQLGSASYAGASFREYGMSLGPQQVLEAENVVVIVSGPKKRNLAERLLSSRVYSPDFPLSIIHHPRVADKVTVFLTEDVRISSLS